MTFNIVNPYRFVSGDNGLWKELGRTTASSGTTLNVSSLANYEYLMTINSFAHSANDARPTWHYNSNTTNSYTHRQTTNGGSEATEDETDECWWSDDTSFGTGRDFMISYIWNQDNGASNYNTKLQTGWNVASGEGSAPDVCQGTATWDTRDVGNTTVIDEINYELEGNTTSFTSGSEAIVLGYDPDEPHTDSFWEELADVKLGSADTIDTGTFTAKKYLWFQVWCEMDSTTVDGDLFGRFNGDTGSNYNYTKETNAGGFSDFNSQTKMFIGWQVIRHGTGGQFANCFINNPSGYKHALWSQGVNPDNPNNGSSYPVYNSNCAGVWDDTDQINRIQLFDSGGNDYRAGSWLKVWGAD